MATNRIAVVGLGLLGRGIAACFAGRGFQVIGVEPDPSTRDQVRSDMPGLVREVEAYTGQPSSGSFEATADLAAIRGSSLLIESVVEDLAIKQQVLREAESYLDAHALIATNTSAIPITLLQTHLAHPERFLGLHFAGPAHITRFCEIIRGDQTSDAACERATAVVRQVGKEPSVCRRDVPGFIVNRIAYAMYREAFHLLDTGVADAATIDTAVRNALSLWANICGPLRWIDISGGPALYARAMQRVLPTLCNDTDVSATLRRLLDADARGTTSGDGIFHYEPADPQHWARLWSDNARRSSELLDQLFPLPEKEPSHD
ncbi:MAG: 3-hydroxyacyl-CoA dehydrogenase family protein [Gemmataceae bacterium]